MKLILSLFLLLPLLSAQAEDAPLDKAYPRLRHPRVEWDLAGRSARVRKSDLPSMLEIQTEVKSQGHRGTCSIFSATALFEALLVKARLENRDIDLSEEWLQYLISQNSSSDGSSSPANFYALEEYGQASESKMPYIGESWESASSGLAAERCGELKGYDQKRCLVGHRSPLLLELSASKLLKIDPEFAEARADAEASKKYFSSRTDSSIIGGTGEVKELLAKGTPLTLDIDFYYGAWNHRVADELGLGRDMDLWGQGIVTYPERDSLDFKKSPKKPAGHSIVIVGYDDDKEITYSAKMTDGSTKSFTRKGVYYFKNSWGTDSFGAKFRYQDNAFPGYGMISQDYANEYGQFFRFEL